MRAADSRSSARIATWNSGTSTALSNGLTSIGLSWDGRTVEGRFDSRPFRGPAMVKPRRRHRSSGEHGGRRLGSRFTSDKLLDFLKRLDRKVTIQISQSVPAASRRLRGGAASRWSGFAVERLPGVSGFAVSAASRCQIPCRRLM